MRLPAHGAQAGRIHPQRAAQQAEVVQRGGLVALGCLNVKVHLLSRGGPGSGCEGVCKAQRRADGSKLGEKS